LLLLYQMLLLDYHDLLLLRWLQFL